MKDKWGLGYARALRRMTIGDWGLAIGKIRINPYMAKAAQYRLLRYFTDLRLRAYAVPSANPKSLIK